MVCDDRHIKQSWRLEDAGLPSGFDDTQQCRRGRPGRDGIADSIIRLSVGLEDIEDLKADLDAALSAPDHRRAPLPPRPTPAAPTPAAPGSDCSPVTKPE